MGTIYGTVGRCSNDRLEKDRQLSLRSQEHHRYQSSACKYRSYSLCTRRSIERASVWRRGAQVVKLLLQNRHVRLSPLALITKALSDLVKVADIDMVELFTSRQQIIERAVSFFGIESLTVSDACTGSDKHVGIYRYYISAKSRR